MVIIGNLLIILSFALIYATPLFAAALGGLYSEKSGVVNIGLEGMMTFGAFSGTVTVLLLNQFVGVSSGWILFVSGIIVAALGGALWALLHGYASIKLGIDQVISGTVINILTLAIGLYLTTILWATKDSPSILNLSGGANIPIKFDPISFTVNNSVYSLSIYYVSILILLIAALTWYVFKYTKFGAHISAVGENPSAADAMGINVYKVRYTAVIISGMLAGLGGFSVVLMTSAKFAAYVIAGKGFVSLAVLIFGRYNAVGILGAGLLFGFTSALGRIWPTLLPVGKDYSNEFLVFLSQINTVWFLILPYIVTVITLILFSRKSVSPSALGKPYQKEQR